MRKVRERIFAAALAAALLFTTPGTVSYAADVPLETVSVSVTEQVAAGETEKENLQTGAVAEEAISESAAGRENADGIEGIETGGNDKEKSEPAAGGTAEPETQAEGMEKPGTGTGNMEEPDTVSGDTAEPETEIDAIKEPETDIKEVSEEGAEGTPDLELFGQKVVSGDRGDGWSYADGVLTLDSYHVEDSTEDFIHITNADLTFTLYLKGENAVKTSGKLYYGNVYGSTTITGDQGASLSLDGLSWADRHMIIRGVKVDADIQYMIFLAYSMLIDNAEVNFNLNGSSGYIYATHSGLTIKNGSDVTMVNSAGTATCCVYADESLVVTDSTLKVTNTNPEGYGVYVTKVGADAERKAVITNSTIAADVGLAAIHCDDEAILTNSQLTSSGQFLIRSKSAVTVDADSRVAGITKEHFKSAVGLPVVYQVYGQSVLAADLTVAEGESFGIPEGASLTIPAGTTLENNGTMHIHDNSSLSGAGVLTGNGSFQIDVTEDMISIPEGLTYTGTEYTDQIKLGETAVVCGAAFTADTKGWTRSIEPAVVKDAGEYKVSYTNGDKTISKTFTVAACGHPGLVYEPTTGGKHGGTCAVCSEKVLKDHEWKNGACLVCKTQAVAKVEKDGAVIGYLGGKDFEGTEGAFLNNAYQGAAVTLLADVQPGTELLDGTQVSAMVDIDCTLDLAGHKFTSSDVAIYTLPRGNLTILDSSFGKTGQVVSTGNAAVVYEGVMVLKGGTYMGNPAIQAKGRTDLSGILPVNEETHYAFYDADGVPVLLTDWQGKEELTGQVTVRECRHQGGLTDNGDGTHSGKCSYCGAELVSEGCNYQFSANSGTCLSCGSTLTVSVTGTDKLVYDGSEKKPAVTVKVDGNATLTAGTDYTVTYADNIKAGDNTAYVTVKGTGFQGTFTQQFSIGKASPVVAWSQNTEELIYTGQPAAITPPNVTLIDRDTYAGDFRYSYASVGSDSYISGLPVNAGEYTVKAGSEEQDNYTAADSENILSLKITKAEGTLTVPQTPIEKIFGDQAFSLGCSTNGDGRISYASDKESVALVSAEGIVQIKGAGTANIIVTLAEGKNYTSGGSQTVIINVAKMAGYKADALVRSYLYLEEHTDSIDLTPLLPKDCGAAEYGTPAAEGDVVFKEAAVSNDGKLSYTVGAGNVGDEGIITVVVKTQNYEDIRIAVNVKLSDCDHVTGDEILYTGEGEKAPACTEKGLGHRECTKCGSVMESGITVPALGHDYTSEVTKEPTASAEGEKTYTCSRCGHTYTESIPRTTPEGLWVSGLVSSVTYTGSAVKPEGIRIYHGSTLLREKTEYTLAYKNNIKAGTAQVIVTGKGSYKGKATAEFTITPVDISVDHGISIFISTVSETGKTLKPTVTVTWNGRKLKEKTDYTLTYQADIKTASAEGYDVTVNGTGNYTGIITEKFRVASRGTPLLNKATVKGVKKSYEYDAGVQGDNRGGLQEDRQGGAQDGGQSVTVKGPKGLEEDLKNIIVKVGNVTLTKDADYTVHVENAGAVGTGYVVIEAVQTGAYAGEKRIPFKVTGIDLKKGSVVGIDKIYPYTSEPVMPKIKVYTGKNGTGTQLPADVYTVRYSNCINQGKATVTVTGIPEKGYSGSIKATYSIGRLDLAAGENAKNIAVTMPAEVKYAKGGAKPQPVIIYSYGEVVCTLREGVDYILKYSNNKTKYETGTPTAAKMPTLKITGIGNYSGTITKNFAIGAQDIGRLEIAAADKAYNSKKRGSYYYSVPKVYDLDGKLLASGKDYTVQYIDEATGKPIGKTDMVENGTQIRVTVTARENGNYAGALSGNYFVRNPKDVKDIAKVKNEKIAARQYTGSEITPEVSFYTLTGKTKQYLTEEDYEIIGYYNNVKKGMATVLVKGRNAYSGVKSITFKITAADNQSIWNGTF